MFTEASAVRLLSYCHSELGRLVVELDTSPSRTAFYDISAVAEVVVLTLGLDEAEPFLSTLREAAARWLRCGLLEDLLVSQAEFAYHTTLLCYLAQSAASYEPSDLDTVRALCDGRFIARSEAPVLRQQLITAYLAHCGVVTDFGHLGRRNLAQIVDRRVLRARSDEFDLLVLLMCAQLQQLEPGMRQTRPKIYPQVQLVQAIRDGNTNWIPVLTFLCSRFSELPGELRRAAIREMQLSLPPEGQLLPAPPLSHIDSEYVGRSERGLRLRSTIVSALMLTQEGNAKDDAHVGAAYA